MNIRAVDVLVVAVYGLTVVEGETVSITHRSGAPSRTGRSNTRAYDKSPLFGAQRLPVLLLLKTARHNQKTTLILGRGDVGVLGTALAALCRLAAALKTLKSKGVTLGHLVFDVILCSRIRSVLKMRAFIQLNFVKSQTLNPTGLTARGGVLICASRTVRSAI